MTWKRGHAGLPGQKEGKIFSLSTTACLCMGTQTACDRLLNIKEDKGDISTLDTGLATSPGDRPASDWELTLGKAPQ